ncbi:MAG: hypothetical protein JHC41_01225 [Nitrosopumilus sp.]|nr:hypothetical protein [Nitrosopumilus sp.]
MVTKVYPPPFTEAVSGSSLYHRRECGQCCTLHKKTSSCSELAFDMLSLFVVVRTGLPLTGLNVK